MLDTSPLVAGQGHPRDPEAIKKTIVVAFGCPLVRDGHNLLLTTTCALITGHGEIKLVAASELPPHWLAFIELKGAVETVGEEKSSAVLPKSVP